MRYRVRVLVSAVGGDGPALLRKEPSRCCGACGGESEGSLADEVDE